MHAGNHLIHIAPSQQQKPLIGPCRELVAAAAVDDPPALTAPPPKRLPIARPKERARSQCSAPPTNCQRDKWPACARPTPPSYGRVRAGAATAATTTTTASARPPIWTPSPPHPPLASDRAGSSSCMQQRPRPSRPLASPPLPHPSRAPSRMVHPCARALWRGERGCACPRGASAERRRQPAAAPRPQKVRQICRAPRPRRGPSRWRREAGERGGGGAGWLANARFACWARAGSVWEGAGA